MNNSSGKSNKKYGISIWFNALNAIKVVRMKSISSYYVPRRNLHVFSQFIVNHTHKHHNIQSPGTFEIYFSFSFLRISHCELLLLLGKLIITIIPLIRTHVLQTNTKYVKVLITMGCQRKLPSKHSFLYLTNEFVFAHQIIPRAFATKIKIYFHKFMECLW
jgi:hypothetical protein